MQKLQDAMRLQARNSLERWTSEYWLSAIDKLVSGHLRLCDNRAAAVGVVG